MSELAKCKVCRNASGFLDRNHSKICPTCHGSGRQKKRQRGYHSGDNGEKIGKGTEFVCARGHPKTGTGIDDNGEIRTFCPICHNIVTNNTKAKRREKVA